jgi:hypothetical protein
MILFKLRCAAEHEFEAWFRDGATYERQAGRNQIACPDCGDTSIEKAPMAPRVARRCDDAPQAPPSPEQVRGMLRQLRKHVETNCDYVGPRFAEEARRMHRGDAAARGIYGEASEDESQALADDGIQVARIPWLPPNDA